MRYFDGLVTSCQFEPATGPEPEPRGLAESQIEPSRISAGRQGIAVTTLGPASPVISSSIRYLSSRNKARHVQILLLFSFLVDWDTSNGQHIGDPGQLVFGVICRLRLVVLHR